MTVAELIARLQAISDQSAIVHAYDATAADCVPIVGLVHVKNYEMVILQTSTNEKTTNDH